MSSLFASSLAKAACAAMLLIGAHAAEDAIATPAVAAKISLRGGADGMKVPEMRVQRKNDVLVVQADLQNTKNDNRRIYYRFRWLDNTGGQVGDGESWKQLGFLGQQMQTIKGVAPQSQVTDFRLEMNVEAP